MPGRFGDTAFDPVDIPTMEEEEPPYFKPLLIKAVTTMPDEQLYAPGGNHKEL